MPSISLSQRSVAGCSHGLPPETDSFLHGLRVQHVLSPDIPLRRWRACPPRKGELTYHCFLTLSEHLQPHRRQLNLPTTHSEGLGRPASAPSSPQPWAPLFFFYPQPCTCFLRPRHPQAPTSTCRVPTLSLAVWPFPSQGCSRTVPGHSFPHGGGTLLELPASPPQVPWSPSAAQWLALRTSEETWNLFPARPVLSHP